MVKPRVSSPGASLTGSAPVRCTGVALSLVNFKQPAGPGTVATVTVG
jgi:hypothetical protein